MMWFLDRIVPDPAIYNVPIGWRIEGAIDVDALWRAVQRLAARHAQLRTVFASRNGQPVAATAPVLDVAIRVPESPSEPERLAALLLEETRRPFDLAHGPLFRACLLRGDLEHRLVFTFHHSICDGWSVSTIERDLLELYAAECEGREPRLSAIAVEYADFARNDRDAAARGEYDEHLSWWAEHLRDLPRFELVGDRRPPASRNGRGARVERTLGAEALREVGRFARTRRCTPFATLLAAYAALLSRYADQTEVVIGVPLSGRRHPDLERVVGNFTETATLRIPIDPTRSFAALAATVQDEIFDALTHGPAPFQRVVERVAPVRSQTQNPLFSVMMVEQQPLGESLAGGARFRSLRIDTASAKVDLVLEVVPEGEDLRLIFEYATDRFAEPTVRALLDVYRRILVEALRNPELPLDDLPLADGTADETPLVDAERSASTASLVHRRFRAHAQANPDATAILDDGVRVTYGELLRAADRIRAVLRADGVGRGDLVGLCARRSADLVAAIVAILDAGAAYVPLDPHYPSQRLRHVVEHSGVALIVADRASRDVFNETTARVVLLEEARSGEPATEPAVEVGGDDPAYVIYTSGSTGTPKGVVVEHANVARLFTIAARHFTFGSDDTWTLFHSYAFDFSVWEIWGALAHGGRLALVPPEITRTPREFHRLVSELGVTVLNQTPSAFYEFDAADAAAPLPLALRYVVLGGESIDVSRFRNWFRRHGDRKPLVVNMYGITETTVHVTYRELREADLDDALAPIGVPLGDLAITLRDAKGRPVPTGFIGEIHVSGAGVARGYLHDPELTAARFRTSGALRSYRSGDLARRRADGSYEYVGRADHQVKIRGFRIEPAEIEAALATHPDLERSVVVAETQDGETRLVAYVVPRDVRIAPADLHAHLADLLPAYMIPSAFVPVRTIALNENGKLDRRALASLALPPDAAPASVEPAVSPIHASLQTLFAELLRVPSIGLDDNFFMLGGHSFMAARLAARVEEAFPQEAARFRDADGRSSLLRSFYHKPTVRALATLLETGPDGGGVVACLREGDSARPALFWFHGLYNWHGLYAWNILETLPDIPFYIVHPPGDDEAFAPTIAAITERRLAEIRRLRPHGPYILGGFCNGALTALETGQRLRAAGEEVVDVVMASPPPLVPFGTELASLAYAVGDVLRLDPRRRNDLALALRALSGRVERFVVGDAQYRAAVVRNLGRRIVRRNACDDDLPCAPPKEPDDTTNAYVRAVASYCPRRYDGRVEIVFSTETGAWNASPHAGWGRYARAHRVHQVKGGLLQPESSRSLGSIIAESVRDAD